MPSSCRIDVGPHTLERFRYDFSSNPPERALLRRGVSILGGTMKPLWLFWLVIVLAVIQMAVAYTITLLNREYFDGRPAYEYGRAIGALAKDRPIAALIMRACYALLLVEWAVVYFW
jgi:hypothetical protein